jgi:ATP-dependent Clp protease ATP-binding subunit ClpC
MSYQEAARMGVKYVGTEHILIALMREQDSIAARILNSLNVNIQKVYDEIMSMLGEGDKAGQAHPMGPKGFNSRQKTATPFLDKFSRDLTQMANNFDPIVGRNKEIERVIQILSRRTKNNPCLVGDPGVGKTAIAEGLAQRIANGDVPEIINGKRLVALDLPYMVAGSKYRG